MSSEKKERFRYGPQCEQENKFKGKDIIIWSLNNSEECLRGQLVWVDVYSWGVLEVGKKEPTLVMKGPGICMRLTRSKVRGTNA